MGITVGIIYKKNCIPIYTYSVYQDFQKERFDTYQCGVPSYVPSRIEVIKRTCNFYCTLNIELIRIDSLQFISIETLAYI